MATRATLRTTLRLRLSDPTLGGLFSDAELNAAITEAAARVGLESLRSTQHSGTITAGFTTITAATATNVVEWVSIQTLAGVRLPRLDGPPHHDPTHYALAWYLQADYPRLSRPATSAEVTPLIIATRDRPAAIVDDATPIQFPDSILPAISDRACAYAIRVRLADEVRRVRMVDHSARFLADTLDASADALLRQARRFARGGSL